MKTYVCSRCKGVFTEGDMSVKVLQSKSASKSGYWGVGVGKLCAECYEIQYPCGHRREEPESTESELIEDGFDLLHAGGFGNIDIFDVQEVSMIENDRFS